MNEIIKKNFRSALSVVLVAAMVLTFAGCGQTQDEKSAQTPQNQQETLETAFTLEVTDLDGKTESFEITTDKTTVGEALVEKGLISGEEGQYGLMVDTVNGIRYDYNEDGAYWSFYIDGEYAMTGVDSTDIIDGAKYSFVATKA